MKKFWIEANMAEGCSKGIGNKILEWSLICTIQWLISGGAGAACQICTLGHIRVLQINTQTI